MMRARTQLWYDDLTMTTTIVSFYFRFNKHNSWLIFVGLANIVLFDAKGKLKTAHPSALLTIRISFPQVGDLHVAVGYRALSGL